MKNTAIIVAGGSGNRMGRQTQDKVFIKIKGVPVLICTLQNFERCSLINEIVLVVRPDIIGQAEELIRSFDISKVVKVASGGERRQDSVFNGLKEVSADTDFVYIHDGARPFLSDGLFLRLNAATAQHQAVICGLPVDSTIKKVDDKGLVAETVDRTGIWMVQTPQVFSVSLLKKVFADAGDISVTDEAMMLELLGYPVAMVRGESFNIKITYPHDVELAQLIAETRGI